MGLNRRLNTPKMFNRSKLQKKGETRATELEEEIAKTLQAFETSSQDLQQHLKFVYFNSAEEVEFEQADGQTAKYILVRIPYRSLNYFKKVGPKVIENLEAKFKWPIIVIANRTIQSKRAKTHASQMRPRSRTLKAVHQAILNDIVCPSSITGRSVRVASDARNVERVFLDPLDKSLVESKIDCMATPMPSLPPTRSTSNSPSQLPSRRRSLTSSRRRKETELHQDAYDDDTLVRMMPGNDDYNCRNLRSKSETLQSESIAFGVLVPASS